MTRTTPSSPLRTALTTTLALTLLAPLAALAQMGGSGPLGPAGPGRSDASRLLYEEDLGANQLAKLEATYEDEQLCVTLALAQVPRGLRTGNFNFVRNLHVDETKRNHNLKIKFPRKPEAKNDSSGVWKSCVEAPPRLVNAERDEIHVTVRQFDEGGVRPTETYTLEFPTSESKSAMWLARDPYGNLIAGG